LQEICMMSGKDFDPMVIDAFMHTVKVM
jgi:response regulator RpfG family c-di-GMP phosphodiesterase